MVLRRGGNAVSKTGGGRGTSQYETKGRSQASTSGRNAKAHAEPETSLEAPVFYDWDLLLSEFPFQGGEYQALPEPTWDETTFDAEAKGISRAVSRFKSRMAGALHLDSEVERLGFTEPELVQLIGNTHVPGHTEGEELQMRAMVNTAKFAANLASENELEPSIKLTDDLMVMMSPGIAAPSFQSRGNQHERYGGPFVSLGNRERFEALDARLMHRVFEAGTQRVSRIESVPVRAATWAAFVAYHQPYLDGNKRVGRYSINAVLMSQGFDAITIPASKKEEYLDEVVGALKTGDLTSHIRFLLSQYDDS